MKTADTTYVGITVAEDGEFSQKSASLALKKWKYLCDNVEAIKLAVKNYISRGREDKYNLHLGKNQFVSVEEGVACVDMRKWYKCPNRETIVSNEKWDCVEARRLQWLDGAIARHQRGYWRTWRCDSMYIYAWRPKRDSAMYILYTQCIFLSELCLCWTKDIKRFDE